jgi:AcrR family transcriptional regulator
MDELIRHASLVPELSPRNVKYTSEQGRSRRILLLVATRELLRDVPPEAVTFAMVCARADIPRASAYHFFPNIQALFFGLRLVHAETLLGAIVAVDVDGFDSWPAYVLSLIEVGAEVTQKDPGLMRLIYGAPGNVKEAQSLGKVLDAKIATNVAANLRRRFRAPTWDGSEGVFAIAFAIIDAVFRLSFRQHGEITDAMVREAGRAATAYLSGYIPAHLPPAPSSDTTQLET